MKSKSISFFLLAILILVSACTIQKRTYRKGYYVHLNSSLNKKDKIAHNKKVETQNIETNFEEPLFASNDKTFIIPAKKPIRDSIKTVSCGDSLWLISGSVSSVKILEVSDVEVKFKRCANLKGPVIVISKEAISKIKYSNGLSESYENERKSKAQKFKNGKLNKERKLPPRYFSNHSIISAIISLAFLAIGLLFFLSYVMILTSALFFGLSAVALGFTWAYTISSFHKMKKEPDYYKGKGITSVALVLAILYALGLLAIAIFGVLVLAGSLFA